MSFLCLIAGEVIAQPATARHFYAANQDGTGINQWVKRTGYRVIFEFFKINPNDQVYQRRILYVFDNDPKNVSSNCMNQ